MLVCGPANFPTRKKEKQNAARKSHMEQLGKIGCLLDRIRRAGSGSATIKSSDGHAAGLLRAKIDRLEALQGHMKAVNAYYRRHRTLEGCGLLSEEQREETVRSMESRGQADIPFPPYRLTSNRQKTAACKKRLAGLEAAKDRGSRRQSITVDGEEVEITEDTDDMRIRFLFPAKPSSGAIAVLKRHAFKWSPKNRAWQRQLTPNARYAAKQAIEELAGQGTPPQLS